MKKLIYSIAFLIFGICALNAQKCEYLEDHKDEFTGKHIRQTAAGLVREFLGKNANLIFERQDDTYFLKLNYNFLNAQAVVASPESKLHIKLRNDSILTFEPIDIFTGNVLTNFTTTTQIIVTYHADIDQIKTLAKNPVKKVRVSFTNGSHEHEVKKKQFLELIHAANCILRK